MKECEAAAVLSALGLKGQRQPDETQASHHTAMCRRTAALPISAEPDVQDVNTVNKSEL